MKLQSFSVEPTRARLLVVLERKPEPLELSDFLAVFISQQINNMRDAQTPKLLDIGPCIYHAAKGKASSHEENFHRPTPACL